MRIDISNYHVNFAAQTIQEWYPIDIFLFDNGFTNFSVTLFSITFCKNNIENYKVYELPGKISNLLFKYSRTKNFPVISFESNLVLHKENGIFLV